MQTLGIGIRKTYFSLPRFAAVMGGISVALRLVEWRFTAPDPCAAYSQACAVAAWPIRSELYVCSVTIAFIAWLLSIVAPSHRYDVAATIRAWGFFAALLIWLLIDASTPFLGSIK